MLHSVKVMGLVLATSCSCSAFALSQIEASPPPKLLASSVPSKQLSLKKVIPKLQLNAKAWVLMSYDSGQVLAGKNIHTRLPPASLAKLMSSYVTSHALANGQIHYDDKTTVSKKAWKTGGSKMFIREGESVSVRDLMRGMIIVSGNDATVALAEHIAGDADYFTVLMNQAASEMGLKDSNFKNPNGLPAAGQYSSAYDLAKLARNLIAHFPEDYKWYKEKSFKWDNIQQRNRNRLLWSNPRVDGMKTGYTDQAKYGFVVSMLNEDGSRLIAVVLGAPTVQARIDETAKLLRFGERFFETKTLYSANEPLRNMPISGGTQPMIPVGLAHRLSLTLNPDEFKALSVAMNVNTKLAAPIKMGQRLGTLVVSHKDKVLVKQDIVALKTVKKGTLWQKISHWGHNLTQPAHGQAPQKN